MPRGRPPGSKNKTAKFLHYIPKKWEAWHESVVIRSVMGTSNTELAELFGVSVTHISNILNCPQALEVKNRIRDQIINEGSDATTKIAGIRDKALKRVEQYLDNDTLATNNPHQTMSLTLQALKLTMPDEVVKTGDTVINNNINAQQNVLIANPEFIERIAKGLEISNQIEEAHRLKAANE